MTNYDIIKQLEKINADQLEHCTTCVGVTDYNNYCLECREAVDYISDLYKEDEQPVIAQAMAFEQEDERQARAIQHADYLESLATPADEWEEGKDCAVCNKTITSEEAWECNDCCENCHREMTGE